MNKTDIKLIGIILLIALIFLLSFKLFEKNDNKQAIVYYENKKVLTVNLNEKKEYKVDGYNGEVIIIVNNGKIKVEQENSPLHLCSKQGYISKSYETIVCLPNKISIKIIGNEELDVVVN
ncbi:MAG: NusG domain II-containing protein [Firmicutes bacterium]|nr:NusG domain II-containing protein [Bacillota bacterium]